MYGKQPPGFKAERPETVMPSMAWSAVFTVQYLIILHVLPVFKPVFLLYKGYALVWLENAIKEPYVLPKNASF